jgi:hypothetical protein
MSSDILGVVPGERQVRLLALHSSSFQTSDLDHLRCGRPICSCKCLNLDHLRCRCLICSCKCLNLEDFRWRSLIFSCKCLNLDHLRCRRRICSYKCLNLDHLRCRRLICSWRCLNLDNLRCRRLICSWRCLNLDHLRCRRPICSCKCLRLSYLASRHLISVSPWSFSTFSDRTCLCNACVSSFVIVPSLHVFGGARSLWRHPNCRHLLSCFSSFRRSGNFTVPGTNSLSSAPPFLWVFYCK